MRVRGVGCIRIFCRQGRVNKPTDRSCLVVTQWLILSEETQLVACFVAFTTTVYKHAGGAIAKSFDDEQAAVIA